VLNQEIKSNNIINPNFKKLFNKNLKSDINDLTKVGNNNIQSINENNQNYRDKIITENLEIHSKNAINLKTRTLLEPFNNKSENISKKLGDSSNLLIFNQEVNEENRFNLKKPNETNLNYEILKKSPIILNRKITIQDLEKERNEISSLKLICGIFKSKKATIRGRFGLHYYHYLVDYIDKTLNIFNYFQTCHEFENLKEILFENYKKNFSNIKPIILIDESEIKSVSEHESLNKNRFNFHKMDRIIANLFNKLDNNEI